MTEIITEDNMVQFESRLQEIAKTIREQLDEPLEFSEEETQVTIDTDDLKTEGTATWINDLHRGDYYTPDFLECKLSTISLEFVEFEGHDLDPVTVLLIENRIEKIRY